MIDKDGIAEMLASSRSMALPPDLDHEAQFVLDSFSLVMLQSVLEEEHGIVFDPVWDELQHLTSVSRIHEYLVDRFPERVAS
jgi:acyl carrier protein